MQKTIAELREIIFANVQKSEKLHLQQIYEIVRERATLDKKDFEPSSPTDETPRWMRNVRNVMQREKETGTVFWFGNANYLFLAGEDLIDIERNFRMELWSEILKTGSDHVNPALIRELRLYEGQAGIWRDLQRTKLLTDDRKGLAISFRHSGGFYPDDLTTTGVVFHYPETGRAGATDSNEIDAAKNAAILQLPVFVVLNSIDDGSLREIKLAYIFGWDDEKGILDIKFSSLRPESLDITSKPSANEGDFSLDDADAIRIDVTVSARWKRDTDFSRRVFQRYGARCAVCDLNVIEMLDAAHLKPKNTKGTDDERNGLPLCASHHRALDARIFSINPESLEIEINVPGLTSDDLKISRNNLSHLGNKPHKIALTWLFGR